MQEIVRFSLTPAVYSLARQNPETVTFRYIGRSNPPMRLEA
jgi:hypothetical protein